MLVRKGTHDRTDGHAVESVIHKDKKPQQHRDKLCTDAVLDMHGCPSSESRCASGLVHQNYHRSQQCNKYQDAGVRDVCEIHHQSRALMIQERIQCRLGIAARIEHRSHRDPHEQRTVYLLCDQCQRDRDDRRKQGQYRSVSRRHIGSRKAPGTDRQNQKDSDDAQRSRADQDHSPSP